MRKKIKLGKKHKKTNKIVVASVKISISKIVKKIMSEKLKPMKKI